jgi:hypothetical protein
MPELGTWAQLVVGAKPLLSLACLWQLGMLGSRTLDPTPKLVISAAIQPKQYQPPQQLAIQCQIPQTRPEASILVQTKSG